jgi:hypothetical protein
MGLCLHTTPAHIDMWSSRLWPTQATDAASCCAKQTRIQRQLFDAQALRSADGHWALHDAAGREFYGPDGVYPFAGRECARALALQSTDTADCQDNLEGERQSTTRNAYGGGRWCRFTVCPPKAAMLRTGGDLHVVLQTADSAADPDVTLTLILTRHWVLPCRAGQV